jgi:hypothetical protein
MNERNSNRTRGGWATGINTAMLAVVIATLGAVWHPLNRHDVAEVVSNAATEAYATAPDMRMYFPSRFVAPSRFAAPETTEQ